MGVVGVVFALFTVGYILGVWTACLVFRQPQRAYEDGVPAAISSTPVICSAARPVRPEVIGAVRLAEVRCSALKPSSAGGA